MFLKIFLLELELRVLECVQGLEAQVLDLPVVPTLRHQRLVDVLHEGWDGGVGWRDGPPLVGALRPVRRVYSHRGGRGE